MNSPSSRWSRMSWDWQAVSCTTAGPPFYWFRYHCGTYVVRRQIGRLHLPVWVPPPWKRHVFGLCNRRPDAAGVRVAQGRDDRSVCVLVPDPRVLDNGFHDATIIDMGDMAEPAVLEDDLSLLDMRALAKKRFRHSRPGACTYCGKYTKCDIYHHVSNYHLDLGQLWRCAVSWCTVWKGTAQDCMAAHNVPPDVKSTSLDRLFPPWTVRRQIWADALRPCHSGISTDVRLFSEIHLSLVHHYRVFRRGLPHFAFRRDYLKHLQIFVSKSSALQQCTLPSPALGNSGPAGNPRPGDGEAGSPKKAWRMQGRKRETQFWEEPMCEQSQLTVVQDVRGLAGSLVYDCRPTLLPGFVGRSADSTFQFGCRPRGSDSGVQWFGSGASSYSGVCGDTVGRPRDRFRCLRPDI